MTYIDVTICDPRETALLAAAVRFVNEVNHSLTNRGHGRFRYSVLPSGGPEHVLPELPELVPLELRWGQSIGSDASQAGREIDVPAHDADGQYLADVRMSYANAAVLGAMLTDATQEAAPPDARSRATALLQTARLTTLSIALVAEALGTTTEYLVTGKEPRKIGAGLRIPPRDPGRPETCPATLPLTDRLVCCERPFNHDDIHEAELDGHSYLRWSYAGRRILPLTDASTAAACDHAGHDTWFDRHVCAEPCGVMHARCTACGAATDPCSHTDRA